MGRGRGSVRDVERLAEMIVSERRRGATADVESARLDYEDAEGSVREAIYGSYVEWDPSRNPNLISHATWKGRLALTDWYREQLGRDIPRAHAFAIDLDTLLADADDDAETTVGATAAMAEASIAHALVLIEDPETRETLRSIVRPIALGFSHAEVAVMNGQTEAWVSSRLRKLRAREDLRTPAQ